MKYYKVIKENFMWYVGAILQDNDAGEYTPLNKQDLWDFTIHNGKEYISARIIENCPEYFERVYPVSLVKSIVYKCKEEAMILINKGYSE